MKPALYFALTARTHHIVAVTTEKTGRRPQWFGRYHDENTPTHGVLGDRFGGIIGRFNSADAAEAKRNEIAAIVTKYELARQPHNDAVTRLYREEREAIEKAFKC